MKINSTDYPHMLPGNQLTSSDQTKVLAGYVHRFTGQHMPDWARRGYQGKPYPVQFADDAEWLANTLFHVTKAGRLDKRHNACQSSPKWPFNPELRDLSDTGPYATAEDAETAKTRGVTINQLRLDRAKDDKPIASHV